MLIFDSKEYTKKELIYKGFIYGILIGILIHGFALTNKWPNWDDLGQMWDTMDRATSGRWFLKVPAAISGKLSMPWVNGILAIFYIVVAGLFVCNTIKVTNLYSEILIISLMLASPVVGSMSFYTNCFDAYAFGILLSSIGVWIMADNWRWSNCIIGGVFLVLGLGCYQAYLGYAAGIIWIAFIDGWLYQNENVKSLVIKAIKCIVFFAGSVCTYILISKLAVKSLTNYMGIAQMGEIDWKQIPLSVVTAYREFWNIIFLDTWGIYGRNIILIYLVTIICLTFLIKQLKKRLNIIKVIGFILLIIAFPVVINIIFLMGTESVHRLMMYGVTTVGIFAVYILDKTYVGRMWKCISKVGIYLIAGIILCNAVSINMAYLASYISYEEVYAYSNRLILRIESVPGYHTTDKVYFVGKPEWDHKLIGVEWMDELPVSDFTGVPLDMVLSNNYSVFLRKYLGFGGEIINITIEELKGKEYDMLLDSMSEYPSDGSIIKTVEGDIVVNF